MKKNSGWVGFLSSSVEKLTVVGDVHGNMARYLNIVDGSEATVQVGDFGFGFVGVPDTLPPNHYVLVGNHDNRKLARTLPYVLADWGWFDWGALTVFFISGGFSPDKQYRVPGRDWWEDEELSIVELNAAIAAFQRIKPDIMITHEAPESILTEGRRVPWHPMSRTAQALEACRRLYKPRIWLFGHHHVSIPGVGFYGLAELETYVINR